MGATRLTPWKNQMWGGRKWALGIVYQIGNGCISRWSVGESALAIELTYKSIS